MCTKAARVARGHFSLHGATLCCRSHLEFQLEILIPLVMSRVIFTSWLLTIIYWLVADLHLLKQVNTFQIRIGAGFEKRIGYFWPSSSVDTGENERRTTVARLQIRISTRVEEHSHYTNFSLTRSAV